MSSWWNRTTKTYSGETKKFQGSDGSGQYLKNKGIRFIIGQYNTGASVSFKPYLTNYSINLSQKLTDESKEYIGEEYNKIYAKDTLGYEVSLTLDLLAHSINEAKLNIKRLNELGLMFNSLSSGDQWQTTNIYMVSLVNLIGAKYTTKKDIDNMDTLKEIGVPCFIEEFDFSIDQSMGMFEQLDELLAKKYTLNLKLKIANGNYAEISGGNEFLWLPYKRDAGYFTNDVKTFPFGIEPGIGDKGTDGSDVYAANRGAKINIGLIGGEAIDVAGEVSPYVTFKSFLKETSWKLSGIAKVEEQTKTGLGLKMISTGGVNIFVENKLSFDVLSHSINEARSNMLKIQQLLRIIDQFVPNRIDQKGNALGWSDSRTVASRVYVHVPTIISSDNTIFNINTYDDLVNSGETFYINGASFDFDLKMGFFEYSGLLLFKKFTISLDLKRISKQGARYNTYNETPESPDVDLNSEGFTINSYVFTL